jgi:hypothetical protein
MPNIPNTGAATLSRRHCLQFGGLGVLGVSLPHLLQASERNQPAPVRSCVLFLLHGGPSQLDIWDMKPEAPVGIRSEFHPAATNVPGLRITELLPLVARQSHRLSIVHSMTNSAINHNAATYLVTTGNPPRSEQIAFTPTEKDFPHLGAQLAFGSQAQGTAPTAVSLPDPVSDGPYSCPGQNSGFLSASYAPFSIFGDPNDDDFVVHGLHEAADTPRLADRRVLLKGVDGGLGRLAADRRIEELGRYQKQAFALFHIPGDSARFRCSKGTGAHTRVLWPA